ncbi:MAG: DUF502 domain-containing protein [Halobacteriaceae archaeon]
MKRIKSIVRDSFVGGLIILGPLLVTLFVFKFAFDWLVGVVDPIVSGTQLATYTANIELAAQLLALVGILVLITVVGLVAQLSVGRRTLGGIGRLVSFIPLFRAVYGGIRGVASSLSDRSTRFEDVVIVEYPRMGVYSLGFVTGDAPEKLREMEEQDAFFVYAPSAPNPTGGALMMVPEEHVHESGLSVKEGLRLIMTTGMTSEVSEDEEFSLDIGGPTAGPAEQEP